MNPNLMYFPCFAMLILTALVLMRMFYTRMKAVKDKTIDVRQFKTYNFGNPGPASMVQAERNFTNLFEVPTLFYMVCAFALITNSVDSTLLTLAWIYVGLRYVHSLVHLTSNKLIPRMSTYGLSWMILFVMGSIIACRVIQTA